MVTVSQKSEHFGPVDMKTDALNQLLSTSLVCF